MYFRGVNQLELRPISNFINSSQASLYQEWIKDFLKNGEDLQIKEIKNMHEQDGPSLESSSYLNVSL